MHQLGNGLLHAFQYDLLSRLPGLLVLHDLVLFHSRAAAFLDSPAVRAWRDDPSSPGRHAAARPALAAWREELLYSYPREGERLFAAHLGTAGDLLPYAYPLFRIPVEASRAVAVHDAFLADAIRGEVPGARVAVVPMPVEPAPVAADAAARLRASLGYGAQDVVVATFGLVTPEKRLASIARAVAAGDPRLRLLVVGPVPDRAAVDAVLAASGAALAHGRDRPGAARGARGPRRRRRPRRPPPLAHGPRDLGGPSARARAGTADDRVRPRAPGGACPTTPCGGWTRRTRRRRSRGRCRRSPRTPCGGSGWDAPRRPTSPVRTDRSAFSTRGRRRSRSPGGRSDPPARPWPTHWRRPEAR